METSLNFDLRLSGTLAAVSVEVIDSPAGQTIAPVVLPCTVSPQALEDLHDRMASANDLQAIGRALWRCAFGAPAVAELWRASRAKVWSEGILRLRLIIDAPALAALPWELLLDETLGRFLALDAQTLVTRFTRLPIPSGPWPQDRPLRLLFTGSSPSDLLTLNVAKEWTGIEQKIAPLVKQGKLETPDPLPEGATLPSLLAALRRKVDIWHFAGHGTDSGLVFCNDRNKPNQVDAGELGQMLVGEGVRLAVINACRGAAGGGKAASVAGALLRAGIPCVVAMQVDVSNVAADAFAGAFYDAIAVGQGVDQAVMAARKAIWAAGTSEWWTPALFMRTAEGRLWGKPQGSNRAIRKANDRRIDAAAPSSIEMGKSLDVFVQVRFVDSPVLGLEVWPEKRSPSGIEQESQAVALTFPVDPVTGTIGVAQVELVAVAPAFDIVRSSRRLEVPPWDYSPLVSFTLTPREVGVWPINIDVYDLGSRYIGTLPLDTCVNPSSVQSELRSGVLNLHLVVKVEEDHFQYIKRLIDALGADSPEVRQESLTVLAQYGAFVVEPLLLVLKEDFRQSARRLHDAWEATKAVFTDDLYHGLYHEVVRQTYRAQRINSMSPRVGLVIDTLLQIGAPAVEPLITALQDDYWEIRMVASRALIKVGAPAVEPLIATLEADDLGVRIMGAWVLGSIGDPRAVEPLIVALKDEDRQMRKVAAMGLAEIDDPRAAEPLIVALKDEDRQVRKAARKALMQMSIIRRADHSPLHKAIAKVSGQRK